MIRPNPRRRVAGRPRARSRVSCSARSARSRGRSRCVSRDEHAAERASPEDLARGLCPRRSPARRRGHTPRTRRAGVAALVAPSRERRVAEHRPGRIDRDDDGVAACVAPGEEIGVGPRGAGLGVEGATPCKRVPVVDLEDRGKVRVGCFPDDERTRLGHCERSFCSRVPCASCPCLRQTLMCFHDPCSHLPEKPRSGPRVRSRARTTARRGRPPRARGSRTGSRRWAADRRPRAGTPAADARPMW